MTNETTLYRAYIIRCPRGVDISDQPFLLKSTGASNYQLYTNAEALFGALAQEDASFQPERKKRTLHWVGEGLRDFVKRFGW